MPTQGPAPRGGRGAFTLVEMLIVVGILMILIATLYPAFTAIRRSQRIKRVEAAVEAIANGVQAYQNDYGLYPPAAPPSDLVPAGNNLGARALVYFLALGESAGGRSAPYLPSAFYEHSRIRDPVLIDEWDRPLVYFDTSVMQAGYSPVYDILGAVSPAQGPTGFCNVGRFQLWSCGPNGRNDGGRNLHSEGADDIANFVLGD